MLTLTVVATKGGVEKTILSANLVGLLRDLGLRVLLVDADVQSSLSKYFALSHVSPAGLTKLVTDGFLSDGCISTVQLPQEGNSFRDLEKYPAAPALRLIRSDTREGNLQDWLFQRRVSCGRLGKLGFSQPSPGILRGQRTTARRWDPVRKLPGEKKPAESGQQI